jgi:3-phenylpropionate/trans-cinnamate dioxygenase ferredoxin subunit
MAEVVFGKTSEIENEKVVVRRFGRNRVAVCRFENNYYAFKDVCTHDNAPLDQGELCGKVIECPRHGAKFDVTNGEVLAAPAFEALKTYSVRIDGDEINVNLE